MNDDSTEKLTEKLVARFEETLVADGKAPNTLESYIGDIRSFLEWLESKGNTFTGNLKRFHVTSYKSYLVQNNYEINTINKKINSLQSFNQFLIDEKYITEQVVDLRKDKLKLAAGMDRDAINKLLSKLEKRLDIRLYPHKFRHAFCTTLLKRGVELTTVAKLAGHASNQTTASFYINTSQKDKREAVELL